MEIAERYETGKHTVTIYWEDDNQHADPRQFDGKVGIMLADGHRRYTLGDEEHQHAEYAEAARALHHFAERRMIRAFPRWCRIYLDSRAVLPLGLYDHSGITMYVGGGNYIMDPGGWDSGTVGFIFDSATTRAECGLEDASPERIQELLVGEVEQYDLYLTGQVYGYVITTDEDEEIDSCWGVLGLDAVKEEAEAAVAA